MNLSNDNLSNDNLTNSNLTNNYQTLADLRPIVAKCPRCSLCKFPSLLRVESAAHSLVCPSYDEFKFHTSSGGGMVVMAMSLLDGRSEITEAVRRRIEGCLACGACDVSCKFNSDIEIQEVILQLRRRMFEELGPRPEAAAVLKSIQQANHPLTGDVTSADDWLRDVGIKTGKKSSLLLWIGPHYARQVRHRKQLRQIFTLLQRAGLDFTVLGSSEPYTGRAALELGDQKTFARCARNAAEAIRASGAREVVCLSAEDYTALRNDIPRVAPVDAEIIHLVELYERLINTKRLQPKQNHRGGLAWHDACYLGRLSEPWENWEGNIRKVKGQLITYDPPRPVRRGGNACYEPPRRVLTAITGHDPVEFHRRREYAYSSGEPGQAHLLSPAFARNTARRRLEEATAVGAATVVTECPQSFAMLQDAARQMISPAAPAVTSLTALLHENISGGVQ